MDRRLILGLGAVLALAAGLLIALVLLRHDKPPTEAPPASQGGLVVETGRDDDLKLTPNRPLRCFVNGQFVGEMPVAVCAQRNGVATGALDVGVDTSGALAASNGVGADITPLPPPQPQPVVVETPGGDAANAAQSVTVTTTPQGAAADCWRYAPGGWRQLPTPLTQSACLQALYAGRCQGREEALYGRWGDETLRLTDGRVESSPDNRDFSPLVDPWPGCAGQPAG
jgi:hypothetical protein